MKKYLFVLFFLQTFSVGTKAQITVDMSIEYTQNKDTVLKDTIVPYLRIDFKNNTDAAQYFVLGNSEKYPLFLSGARCCFKTTEEYFKHLNAFEYFVCDDLHYVYIYNDVMDILHTDLRTIGGEEFPQELISSTFSDCYDYLRKIKQGYSNVSEQIIMLDSKQNYTILYDLTVFSLVCGEYEFIFEMRPPDMTIFPNQISQYVRCKEFINNGSLKFKP